MLENSEGEVWPARCCGSAKQMLLSKNDNTALRLILYAQLGSKAFSPVPSECRRTEDGRATVSSAERRLKFGTRSEFPFSWRFLNAMK
jgi:hypothetical protein